MRKTKKNLFFQKSHRTVNQATNNKQECKSIDPRTEKKKQLLIGKL